MIWTDWTTLAALGLGVLGSVLVLVLAGLSLRRRGRRRATGAPEAAPVQDASGVTLTGDVVLSGVASFPRGLNVCGSLRLAEGAVVRGDVTADGDVVLDADAHLAGALTALGRARLGPRARVGSADVGGDAVVALDARIDGRLACERLHLAVAVGVPEEELSETVSVA